MTVMLESKIEATHRLQRSGQGMKGALLLTGLQGVNVRRQAGMARAPKIGRKSLKICRKNSVAADIRTHVDREQVSLGINATRGGLTPSVTLEHRCAPFWPRSIS